MKLHTQSAAALAKLLRQKQVSAVEIAQSALLQIEKTDATIEAFLQVTKDTALQNAAVVDKKIARGEAVPPLAGIPVAVKDNICTAGIPTTCASRMLQNFVPIYNATVVEKLRQAGAAIMGKLNMDEFAMGSSCENSYFKPTKNPWDIQRVPGGSSGGSAAAVAACQVPLALGSDTGGSIRGPAAFCGVVGLKPSYGAVSRFGLVAFASSLEQIGPLARTVDDAALLFEAIHGRDMRDATSKEYCFSAAQPKDIKGLRVGLPKEYFGGGVSEDVRQAVLAAVNKLKALGAQVQEVSLPSTHHALAAYYVISSAEAASNLSRYDGVKYGFSAGHSEGIANMYQATRSEGFGAEVKRRIVLGTFVLSGGYYDAYYKRAKRLQRKLAGEFDEVFGQCDVLATPTAPFTAFKLGEKTNDPLAMYAADVCTVPANLAGLPAISLPCGLGANQMPVGLQLMAPKFAERTLLAVAKSYEQAVGGFAICEGWT